MLRAIFKSMMSHLYGDDPHTHVQLSIIAALLLVSLVVEFRTYLRCMLFRRMCSMLATLVVHLSHILRSL